MNHDQKKIGKIIGELTMYLLKNGHQSIGLHVTSLTDRFEIDLHLDACSMDLGLLLKETLLQERDHSLEEYGWELMGESDQSGELNLLGMCIDEVIFDEEGDCLQHIKLIRKR